MICYLRADSLCVKLIIYDLKISQGPPPLFAAVKLQAVFRNKIVCLWSISLIKLYVYGLSPSSNCMFMVYLPHQISLIEVKWIPLYMFARWPFYRKFIITTVVCPQVRQRTCIVW
jgi:hypothetical protein